MRDEQFDKKISEKLNEIEPIFREADWSRLNAKLRPELAPAHAPNAFMRYSKPFAYAAAALIGVLVYQNVVQQRENEQIRLEVAQLKQRVEAVKAGTTPDVNLNEKNNVSQQDDAVNVVKNHQAVELNAARLTQNSRQQTVRNQQENGGKNIKNSPPPSISTNLKANLATDLKEKNTIQHDNKVEIKNNFNNIVTNEIVKKEENLNASKTVETSSNDSKSVDNSGITNLKNVYSVNSLPILLAMPLSDNAAKLAPPTMAMPILPLRKYQNFHRSFGIGIAASAGERIGSLGLTVGWQFSSNFSLNLGIESMEITRGRFDNDDDFRRKTRRDFRGLFEQGVPPTTQIKSIEFRSKFWQLPIALQYRTPRFKGFSVVASAGLSLNLDNENRFNYEYQTPNASDATATLRQPDQMVGIVDNVSVGLGVQKEWRRLTLQLMPTFQTPLAKRDENRVIDPNLPSPMPHQHPDRNFGFAPIHLRLKAMYNF